MCYIRSKVWFITGAGKGIGRALAETVLQTGGCVIAATKRPDELAVPDEWKERFIQLPLDISCQDTHKYTEAVDQAIEAFGRIDVLVNNAGYGCITNFEETREETIRSMFEVNFFGLLRVTRAILPTMRKQHSGHIFNIASAAGYSAGPVPYHTSKFAVTGFSTSLAFEVAPFGIAVTNVAPGLFRTSFYDRGKWGTEPDIHIDDYDSFRWQSDFIKEASKHEQPGDPVKLANLLIEVADSRHPPLHLAVGADAVEAMDAYCRRIQMDVGDWKSKAVQTKF